MKKTSALLILLFVALSAAACSKSSISPETPSSEKEESVPVKPVVTKEATAETEPSPTADPAADNTGSGAKISATGEGDDDLDLADYMEMLRSEAEEGQVRYRMSLEKKESSPDVGSIEGGLFVTSDGVECRTLELTCIDDIFSFGMELYNDTGSDKTFDQTGFILEKEEGVYINPFVYEQFRIPETVSADEGRLWTAYSIYDPKDLKEGDEISVYYDGVFITKLTVE